MNMCVRLVKPDNIVSEIAFTQFKFPFRLYVWSSLYECDK